MSHVVATAGHVDHGKSTLLRALTGQEPDRLEEERRRGLSIQLGYVWCSLDTVGEVAFIDVPGHEKYVSTALTGLGQVGVVLFVVAADDPWMPQAQEHLNALNSLGVDRGVLVVTRCDLADPAPALARAREQMAGTSLAGLPEVCVSAHTGQGMDQLRQMLGEVLSAPGTAEPHPDVRVWVDRHFTPRGASTVVTGTLTSGVICVGDEFETMVGGTLHRYRVRRIESLGRTRESISGLARVALEVTGRGTALLRSGHALTTPGAWAHTTVVDVRRRTDPGPGQTAGPTSVPRQPLLHLGSGMTQVQARSFDEQHLRLTLPAGVPLRVGDRLLLRDPGNRSVQGFDVLDPAPRASTGRGFGALRAAELADLDLGVGADLRVRGLARISQYRQWFGPTVDLPHEAVTIKDWVLSPARARSTSEAIGALVAAGDPAPTPGSAARSLGLPQPVVEHLVPAGTQVEQGRWIPAGATRSPVQAADRAALERLRQRQAEAPFDAPDLPTLTGMGLDEGTVARLHRAGLALRLVPGVVVLPGADALALERLADLPAPFTTSAARQHLGATRRVTLALLAHLDRAGHTVRLPDDTRRLRR